MSPTKASTMAEGKDIEMVDSGAVGADFRADLVGGDEQYENTAWKLASSMHESSWRMNEEILHFEVSLAFAFSE
jgi:hypothetical protein